MKPKIAIVGGAGFIGRSIAHRMRESFQVKIVDVKPPPKSLKTIVSYVRCDIRKYAEVKKSLEDANLVLHTAIVQIPLINENKSLAYEVNVVGTQNVCKAVEENPKIEGMILTGTWHTIGEKQLKGTIDEEFGFRPDKVENRARLYALSKMAQESIVRFYDEMSEKIYGIIRMGTVLGEGMPEKTAANIFIERGLKGETITPYKHTMYRPMLYVDIGDICQAFEAYANKILNNELDKKEGNTVNHTVNVYYPEPITILELAEIVRDSIAECTGGKLNPTLEIIDAGIAPLFKKEDKNRVKINLRKAREFLGLEKLKSPRESIRDIVKLRICVK